MKISICILFFLVTLSLMSQNNKESFYLHSVAANPGIYLDCSTSGLIVNGEISYGYSNNIFTFSATVGNEVDLFGNDDNFYSLNLLYGREFLLGSKFAIDAYAGLGYFSFKTRRYCWDDNERAIRDNPLTTIGFPISARIRYKFNDFISLGLKFEENINSVNSVFNTGVIVQWSFKRKEK